MKVLLGLFTFLAIMELDQFKELAKVTGIRRKWLALRIVVDAYNSYFDLHGDEMITHRKFLKKVEIMIHFVIVFFI